MRKTVAFVTAILALALFGASYANAQCAFSNNQASVITETCGNVGIGTTNPTSGLHLFTTTATSKTAVSEWGNDGEVVAFGGNGTIGPYFASHTDSAGNATNIYPAVRQLFGANGFIVQTAPATTAGQPRTFTEWMRVTPAGNVGIGTKTPGSRLDVAGDINVSGNINAKYQDVAEWVEASTKIEPGTVVVLDPVRVNEVRPSSMAYDTSAAGVISAKPGISLGVASSSKVQVATSGRVRVKVDASKGPIKIGDLLVTSDKPGMAMKSEPVDLNGIKMHRPGTLIGKALEPLAGGEGEILVLLSLQ